MLTPSLAEHSINGADSDFAISRPSNCPTCLNLAKSHCHQLNLMVCGRMYFITSHYTWNILTVLHSQHVLMEPIYRVERWSIGYRVD
jgi:hypothetical protein